MEEHSAIARLRRRDISGLEVLVNRYYTQAVRSAYAVTRDHGLAEEVVQEAFIRAYQRIDQLDPNRPFAPWFLRSVINSAINVAHKHSRHSPLEMEWGGQTVSVAEMLPDVEVGPEPLAEQSELRRMMWEALDHLPPQQRAAVVMKYYLDMSEAEIARELSVPAGTVKWRLHAARERLQGLLYPLRGRQ